MRKLPLILLAACVWWAPQGWSCSCGYQSPRRQFASADVVFAGSIEEVVNVDKDPYEPRIRVRFKVGRVFKGSMGASFTMHTYREFSACNGFHDELAKVGEELLVYASAYPANTWKRGEAADQRIGQESPPTVLRQDVLDAVKDDATIYGTNICAGTKRWEHAGFDVRYFGAYVGPKGSYPMKDAPPFDESSLPASMRDIAPVCWQFVGGEDWKRLDAPPKDATRIGELLRSRALEVGDIGNQAYRDVWWREQGKGRLAVCSMPAGGEFDDCGAMVALFDQPLPEKLNSDDWSFEADPCDKAK